MEGSKYPRRHIYGIDDEMWGEAQSMAGRISAEVSRTISPSEYVRMALRHRINYDKARFGGRDQAGG